MRDSRKFPSSAALNTLIPYIDSRFKKKYIYVRKVVYDRIRVRRANLIDQTRTLGDCYSPRLVIQRRASRKHGRKISKEIVRKRNLTSSTPFPRNEAQVTSGRGESSENSKAYPFALLRPVSPPLGRQDGDRLIVARNVKRPGDSSGSMELHRISDPFNGKGVPVKLPAPKQISLGERIHRGRGKNHVYCMIIKKNLSSHTFRESKRKTKPVVLPRSSFHSLRKRWRQLSSTDSPSIRT